MLINNRIKALIAAGVWTKLKADYVLAAANAQAAQRNWKQDAYNLSEVSAPTFTADRGYQGNGTSSYLTSGTALNAITGLAQDSCALGVWSLTDASNSAYIDIGTLTSVSAYAIGRNAGGSLVVSSNAAGTDSTAVADSLGMYGWTRRASTDFDIIKNATVTNKVRASGGFSNGTFVVGTGGASFSARQIAVAFAASGLTAVEWAALRAANLAYLQGVGAA
ncbi:hypothetical protein NKJ93_02335 [Mesorhizobium sp. M0028]|uniref:hypothetical protein n=1 Tax=Mesorhizobium sp. M0028 TaxID=2956849 RepID=UPI0033371BF0